MRGLGSLINLIYNKWGKRYFFASLVFGTVVISISGCSFSLAPDENCIETQENEPKKETEIIDITPLTIGDVCNKSPTA